MAYSSLALEDIERLLQSLRIVRVAFANGDERYVIPLGFTWFQGALWGSTRRGRKTELAEQDNRVAFVIDNGVPFETESVVGLGLFDLVSAAEALPAIPLMRARFADNPSWNLQDFAGGLADGSASFWRIRPTSMTGRRFHAPS